MIDTYSIVSRFDRRARYLRRRYLLWQNAHLPDGVVLILVSLVIGLLTGATAAWLKALIHWLANLLLLDIDLRSPDYRLLLWPLFGIMLTAIFQRYVVRGSVSQGTLIIKQDLDNRKYRLSPFTAFNPAIGCSATIGFGASAGSEGPTALCGAAIGSNVGRWFGLSEAWLRLLVAIGGGAGISAIFKSPMGGVLFTLEVLQVRMSTLPVIALIIACLIASSTAYMLSDFTFDIPFVMNMTFSPRMIGWMVLLGVFCGLYCIYYNYVKRQSEHFFLSIRNRWLAVLVTGGIMSICIFALPALYGEGFRVITHLVNGESVSLAAGGLFARFSGIGWVYGGLIFILLVKGILVSASYSGGGVAGDFVPTLFAGAIAGTLFAMTCNDCFGTALPVWFFALTAMGAVMAGTIQAPIMSVFIMCETTNTYAYLFPYLITVVTSYLVVRLLNPRTRRGTMGNNNFLALMEGYKGYPPLRDRVRNADKKR